MKINSIQRDIALKQGGFGHPSESPKFREKHGADMCDRGYNADYCGSFTGKSKPAATFLDKILDSGWFGKFAKYSYEHNIATSALIALVLAGILRPATIMALPGEKDKEDKIYASGQAMASGIMGFLFSTAITSPFDESIKKVFEQKKFARGQFEKMDKKIAELNAQGKAKTITDAAKKELKALTRKRDALNTLVKNIPAWVIGVPQAMLTIALIPPILKYVFGLEKKKKPTAETPKPAENLKIDFIEKDVFKNLKSGVSASDKISDNKNQPSFTSKATDVIEAGEQVVNRVTNSKSEFFAPFYKKYDTFTDNIADKFTSKFVNWKPLNYLADKFKQTNNLFQHCLTVGSVIISGLYMQRTLTNKNLDKDRRNTLAVNQGLTLAVSTAGAYALDKYIKGWWDNVTARFAGHLLNDKDFYLKFLEDKKAIIAENKKLKQSAKKGTKPELKSLPKVDKLIENHSYYKSLNSDEAAVLMKKIKGMSPLRAMIVFGFVYRFFVPVAVTKPANKLGEMYLKKKKEKEQTENLQKN